MGEPKKTRVKRSKPPKETYLKCVECSTLHKLIGPATDHQLVMPRCMKCNRHLLGYAGVPYKVELVN